MLVSCHVDALSVFVSCQRLFKKSVCFCVHTGLGSDCAPLCGLSVIRGSTFDESFCCYTGMCLGFFSFFLHVTEETYRQFKFVYVCV